MTISVIVPVYNTEQYLPRCIDSILAQTFTDYELLLVDDGSTDNSGAICDDYACSDSRIHVIHQKNSGVSNARNTGLKTAKGKYIAFCDSDDYWQRHWLQELVTCMEKQRADLVSARYTIVKNNVNTPVPFSSNVNKCFQFKTKQDAVEFMIRHVLIKGIGWEIWTKLFRKEIIDQFQIRFCETCENFAEDMAFVLEYLLYCKEVALCDCDGYCYVIHTGSMMERSKETIKLNAMNEVSKHFGKRFFADDSIAKKKKTFAVLHFLIMYNQYSKVLSLDRYESLSDVINRISDKKWYRYHTYTAFIAYSEFVSFLGKRKAKQILLLSSYCLHGKWKLHTYISAVFYRFIINGE